MNTISLTIAILALSASSCARLRSTDAPQPQYARLMPNGTDEAKAAGKCAALTSDPDVAASCVRALRGDVCGDGTSHTVDGTLVEVVIGAHDTLDAEAMWTPGKASCVGTRARPMLHRAAAACGIQVSPTCGSGRALVATRLR